MQALEELLGKVAPLITHQDTIMCQVIPPGVVRAAAISLFAFVRASLFLYSIKAVLYRQGFFHRGQSTRLFSLPSTKMQPFWYSHLQARRVHRILSPCSAHVWKSPRLLKCSVAAFPVSPLKLHTCSEE